MRIARLALLVAAAAVAGCSSNDAGSSEDGIDVGLPAEGPVAERQPTADQPTGLPASSESADAGEPTLDADGGGADVVPSSGTCVAGGLYCGGDRVIGDANTLYRCIGSGTPAIVEKCVAGCTVNEDGRADACKPVPGSCAIIAAPKAAYLAYGLHPDASNALAYLKITAGRIIQTIGNAAASAGTHGQDGVADGRPYSAATDLSASGMTDAQVAVLLDQLTSVGFAPYYRRPGYDGWPASESRHLHVIWVGAAMKSSLRSQMRDWHVGKNALASHTPYTFKTWTQCWRDSLWTRYLTKNSATN